MNQSKRYSGQKKSHIYTETYGKDSYIDEILGQARLEWKFETGEYKCHLNKRK